ncbi:hypothetical protein EMCRGX_G004707 [Ephydatia muelleri]
MHGSNYVCPSCFHLLRRRCFASDGFDAVSVQNVGSTYIIVSWDLPTHSNGILINFSLYCNGALAGVLPLTLQHHRPPPLHFVHVLQSRPQTLHSSWNVVLGLISAAASLPSHVHLINKIINPDKSFGSSLSTPLNMPTLALFPRTPCASFSYVQLSSLLVEHTAPNIHDSNKYSCLCLALGPDCYHKTHKGSPRCTQPLSWLR